MGERSKWEQEGGGGVTCCGPRKLRTGQVQMRDKGPSAAARLPAHGRTHGHRGPTASLQHALLEQ